jgi:hypothetical protein
MQITVTEFTVPADSKMTPSMTLPRICRVASPDDAEAVYSSVPSATSSCPPNACRTTSSALSAMSAHPVAMCRTTPTGL